MVIFPLPSPSPEASPGAPPAAEPPVLAALAEIAGREPAPAAALARAGRIGLCLGLAGPALLLYALSAAEAVRRGQDPGPRLAADLARAGLAEPRIPPRG
jgi:hypothetical protein